MIKVLCSSCHTHLADTDINRLDWPLMGEMFSIVSSGWYLRPGMLNLDVFCPACGAFPFHYNPHQAGGNAVGKNLTVREADGKPEVKTIKELLLSQYRDAVIIPTKIIHSIAPNATTTIKVGNSTPEFPCPHCGAKKRFHKKGCALKQTSVGEGPADTHVLEERPNVLQENQPLDKHARLSALKDRQRAESPLIASIAGRVGGMSADKGTGPATEAEVRELLADRESRRMEVDKDVDLRPGEGYQRQNA